MPLPRTGRPTRAPVAVPLGNLSGIASVPHPWEHDKAHSAMEFGCNGVPLKLKIHSAARNSGNVGLNAPVGDISADGTARGRMRWTRGIVATSPCRMIRALSRRPSPDKLALGSRHDWPALQIVRNAESCDGNTPAPQESGLSRATDRPSSESLPITGQRPTRRQFVRGSLSQSMP